MGTEAESLGELSRIVAALKNDIREDFSDLRKQIDGLNVVHADVYAADRVADHERHKALVARIDNIEDTAKAKADADDLAGLQSNLRQLVFVVIGIIATVLTAAILAGVRL